MIFRRLQWVGAVVALLLALLLLAADAGEYSGWSRAGLVALGRGVIPLLVVAGLNFAALDGRRAVSLTALIANLVFLGISLRMASAGAPPFVWIAIGSALLLVIASGGRLLSPKATPP
ncbi:MAG: hypothetical protein ACJ79K_06310 [Gemmatimonadaceae bacterium]